MSVFFGGGQKPTKINKVQINQSVLGYPLPVVMGKAKVQQSLLWVAGLTAKSVTQGGKGMGGGKGGSSYLYSADVIAALVNGPIIGVGDVWSGQSWLSNNNTTENYTVSGGSPSYTPANAGTGVFVDGGVGVTNTYTHTQTDLGAGGAATVSGSDISPMTRVSFGTTLATGLYSIDPSNNHYHFAAADVGRVMQISYSFALNIIKQQENDLIPSSKQVLVGGTFTFHEDDGVIYFTGPNNGKALIKVSGTPTVTGTYAVSGSGPATYKFAAGDIAAEVKITYKIQNNSAVPTGAPGKLAFTVFEGAMGQAAWSLLTTTFPQAALGYTGIAYVAYSPMTLGYAADIQQNVFEVITGDAYGGGIVDCNPVQCILQVLTNKVWGLGAGVVPFPVSAIDNGGAGTWGGAAGTAGARTSGGTAWNWFASNNFFISPVLDHQDSAASAISKWLEAGQCAAFMSEGLLKLVPYGDTTTAANGATWTAPTAFAAALDDTCFVPKQTGEDPVKISSKPWQDAYNTVQVQWGNRGNQYAPEITPESDQAAINRYGSRIEDPQNWEFIRTLAAATFSASMRVKRNVYTRNTYEFTLPYSYSYLECMDVVNITTSSQWAAGLNNANLGIVNLPVRIVKVVDNPDGTLDITAEDYPFGVHQPTIFNKSIGAGQTQQNLFEDPGDSEIVMFEAMDRLTGYQGNQIWIGATGASDKWGSCNIFASQDGTTYLQVGTIDKVGRLGVLHSTLATGADPDTVNSMVVDLVENSGALEAGTSTDADQNNTLCFVDGEILSYSACAISGQDQYTMGTYIRRGQMGSVITAHAAGGLFLRLDDAVFKFTYDPSWRGKTLHFKFQSVNTFGNAAQDPSTLTAVTFVVPGDNSGTVDASSGLILGSAASQPQDAIVHVGTCAGGGGNCFDYRTFSTQAYTIAAGDKLEFDVFVDPTSPDCKYSLDFLYTGTLRFKDSLCADQNNIDAHASNDLSAWDKGRWYHREFDISSLAGLSVSAWYSAHEGDTAGTDIGRLANVKVTNGTTLKASIFSTSQANGTMWGLPTPNTLNYSGVQTYTLDLPGGIVDPSTVGVASKGGIPPSTSGSIAYASTTTAITWTWTGLTIFRADNTTTAIPNSNFTDGSLTSATTYFYYPYYDDSPVQAIGWINGSGHGTFGRSFLSAQRSNTLTQQQNLQAFIPLSTGPISGATVASGTGGGSGGGNGGCVRGSMLVREKTKGIVPAFEIEVGDYLSTRDGWTRVTFAQLRPQDLFIRVAVTGYAVEVAPTHPFTAMDENCNPLDAVAAGKLTLMHQLYTVDGAAFVEGIRLVKDPHGTKMVITCEGDHTFYSGDVFPYILTHNFIMQS